VDRYHWLLFLHVSGAFLLLGGAVMAGVFKLAALRRERPSEVALLLGLTRWAVISISVGLLVTIAFGLWLVHDVGYGWGDGWIVASLVLWALTGFLGSRGGRLQRETRALAERLAGEGDTPSPELHARLHDRVALALSWSSGLAALVILALMIWKPGA
jgi:uncharacterized membrane protein